MMELLNLDAAYETLAATIAEAEPAPVSRALGRKAYTLRFIANRIVTLTDMRDAGGPELPEICAELDLVTEIASLVVRYGPGPIMVVGYNGAFVPDENSSHTHRMHALRRVKKSILPPPPKPPPPPPNPERERRVDAVIAHLVGKAPA